VLTKLNIESVPVYLSYRYCNSSFTLPREIANCTGLNNTLRPKSLKYK